MMRDRTFFTLLIGAGALSFAIAGLVVFGALEIDRARAQTPACDLTEVAAMLQNSLDVYAAGDDTATLVTLADLQHEISSARSICTGLAFSSEADGMQPVVSVTLGEGTWIATAESEGGVNTTTTLMDGECDLSYGYVIALYAGNARAQRAITSAGCTFLMEVNAVYPWTLSFEKVS